MALQQKQIDELQFWKREILAYVRWHSGEIESLYGIGSPQVAAESLTEGAHAVAAIKAWASADAAKYLDHLDLDSQAFERMRVLDVGCGPIPYALCFADCEIVGLDELCDEYAKLGFPLSGYDDRLEYVSGSAEHMPFPPCSFDAVISVNAIDHVSDIRQAANEIARVIKPGGLIRIEAHYHEPTVCEPVRIDDAVMKSAFAPLRLRKIRELPFSAFYPGSGTGGELLTVWST